MTVLTSLNHLRLPLLLSLTLLAACQKPEEAEDEAEQPAVPVAVTPVVRDRIAATYRGTATIQAHAEATVVAKVAGVAEQVTVEEGDPVEANAVLARLDAERLQLELDRARAQFNKLDNELKRTDEMYRQRLISREDHDRKRFEHAAAKADLALAELNLRESVIRAPIAGIVSARLIKPGNMVQLQQEVFRISDLSQLEADLHVPERDMRKLAVGQPARVAVDTWDDRGFSGQVLRINPVVNADTGTVKVTVALDNQDGLLRPGMFGRFQVEYDARSDTLLIPKDAVLIEDAAASVFVIEQAKAQRRSISLGYSDARFYEVREGLSEGDLVVTTGRASLKDGAAAEIVETRG